MNNASGTVAVVGLGYVGLPLALAFGRVVRTIGFDISAAKIRAYREGVDPAREQDASEFSAARLLEFTGEAQRLAEADVIIAAVPTPLTAAKQPDLEPLRAASETIGRHMREGALVIFESTVYPGVTEEFCGPILAAASGLRQGVDFKLGYSPERINPGDRERRLHNIVKVVAAQDDESLERAAQLYEQVVDAGVHRAPNIRVAEAAKVIENTQRDLNIALMNELAIIFGRLGIDTRAVLEAAGTKWNFLPFQPGLVGGHCIGIDPYYLTYRAQMAGYQPQVILAGRQINDGMGKYVAEQTVKQMIALDLPVRGAEVLVLGITFKENCGDVRNTRVIDIVEELQSYGVSVRVHDPLADADDVRHEYGFELCELDALPRLSAVVAAVAHEPFRTLGPEQLGRLKAAAEIPLMDVKCAFDPAQWGAGGFRVWRL